MDTNIYRFALTYMTDALISSARQIDRFGRAMNKDFGSGMGTEAAEACRAVKLLIEKKETPLNNLLDAFNLIITAINHVKEPGAIVVCLRIVLKQFADATGRGNDLSLRENMIKGIVQSQRELERMDYCSTKQLIDPEGSYCSETRGAALRVLSSAYKPLLGDESSNLNNFQILTRVTGAVEDLAAFACGQPVEQFAATALRALLEAYKTYYVPSSDDEVPYEADPNEDVDIEEVQGEPEKIEAEQV